MPLYTCEIKGSGAALDAYLNEYHLYSSLGAAHNYSANLRAWMEKANSFRIKVHASAKARAGEPVQFTVLATAAEHGQRRTLCEMGFPGGVAAPDAATLPFDTLGRHLASGQNLEFACEDSQFILEKPWQTDGRLIKDAREIYQLYAEIQSAFLVGDIAKIMALSDDRITFGAKLYDKKRADFERQVLNDLNSTLAGRPNWKLVQQPERELTVHEFLPGKVVRVLDLHGNPPLRTVADKDGFQFGYDVILAQTAGGLVWIM